MTAMRRTGTVATVVVALLFATAGGASTGKEGGTFRVVEGGLASTIDPALVRYPPEFQILDPACGGLVAFQDKPLPAGLRVVPDLAEALPKISRNGKTYTFRIRKDARFSNGKPVTARDFVHALERILNPAMKSTVVRGPRVDRRRAGDARRDDDEARRSGREGQDPDAEADEAGGGLRDDVGRAIGALRGARVPSRRSRRREGAPSEPGPLLRLPVRAGRADRPRAEPLLQGRTTAARRPVRRRARCRHRHCLRAGSKTVPRTTHSAHRRTSSTMRPGSRGATASTRRQFFVVPAPGVRMFALEREPATLQGQRQAPAGGQLRRRSPGADPRARRVRGHRHRPVPAVDDAGARPGAASTRSPGRT